MMKANISAKHALCLDEWKGSILALPWSDRVPGTWISYLVDENGKMIPGGWSEVGFGPFDESYQREAYDWATAFLSAINPENASIAFHQLEWSDS